MIYGSTTPLQSVGELSDMGYHLVFRPLSGMQLYSNLPTTFYQSSSLASMERRVMNDFGAQTYVAGR